MSVRIRVLLLAIAAALYPGETASACPGCLLLSPFRWLFGCDQYHGCGLVNPHNCNRVIDDWLGYGYLRNQQGTLGHYPGNWYRQPHPHQAFGWHGGGVVAGGYGMMQPAMGPLPMSQPMMMPMPMPMSAGPIYSGSWDPCCEMSVPMMSGAGWGGDCCDPCGGGTVMYGAPVAPQMMYEGSSGGDCGCSGGSGGTLVTPPAVPPAGMYEQPLPMSWQAGGLSAMASYSGYPGNPGYPVGMQSMPAPWNPATAWQPQPMQPQWQAQAWRPQWPIPQMQAQQHPQFWQGQPLYAQPQYAQNQYVSPWQVQQMQAQHWHTPRWQAQQFQAQQMQAQQMQVQPWGVQPMPLQGGPVQPWSPVVQMEPRWSGSEGGIAVGPAPAIGGSARLPLRRVSLSSPPLGSVGSRSYPNALR
ncbi:MAG: hypothetical protein RL215_2282 [Planctomycetota bacterium]